MTGFRISRVRAGAEDRLVDLVLEGDRIARVEQWGPGNPPADLDGGGGTLVPGLVDDHLHIGAWLRSRRSVEISASDDRDDAIGKLLSRGSDDRGWIVGFGVDHHQNWGLSAVTALDTPTLLMHRTGRLLYMNGPGAQRLGLGQTSTTSSDRGTWARALGPSDELEEQALLSELRDALLSQGVIRIRDATPYPSGAEGRLARLRRALDPIQVSFMGAPAAPVLGAEHLKLLTTPASNARSAQSGLPYAVHATEPEEIVRACDFLGVTPGRIEHASIVPPAVAEILASRPVSVCANPGFLVERRPALESIRLVGLGDCLHPVARLADYGIPFTLGSDAPVTRPGVLSALRSAVDRARDAVPFEGQSLRLAVAIAAATAGSDLVDATADDWVGRRADVSIWPRAMWAGAMWDGPVTATLVGGRVVWARQSSETREVVT